MIDLNNIMRYHENNRIEAKKAAGGFPTSLWETYSAFANTIGGLILLGVEESRDKNLTVTGVPDAQGYADTIWQTVQDPTKVSVNILSPEDVAIRQGGPGPPCAPGRPPPAAGIRGGQPLHRLLPPGRGGGLPLLRRSGPGHAPGPGGRPCRPGRAGGPLP